MSSKRLYRKRRGGAPRDGSSWSATLRQIGDHVAARNFAAGLSLANHAIAQPGLGRHEKARVLSLVADNEFKRGAFTEAANIYLQAAARNLDHHRQWMRPHVGTVRALLKAADVEQAAVMARQAVALAEQKMRDFDAQVSQANRKFTEQGVLSIPALPPRVSVVATRFGHLFLKEGEPEIARELFEKALACNPRGGCRARLGLAEIALANQRPEDALAYAADAVRRGRYQAKTISAWPLVIAARHKLGGRRISDRLINGLEKAAPALRARATLTIVRELRRCDMWQWREVADRWMWEEGSQFPHIAVEIQKLRMADAKTESGPLRVKREAANSLMQWSGLSAYEWLAAAKEWLRTSLFEGHQVKVDSLLATAVQKYGQPFYAQAAHSLALSCMKAKRHDLARTLLRRNLTQLMVGTPTWAKSTWALARMESAQGQPDVAAQLYRQFFEATQVPTRFRLQAQLLWAQNLLMAGQTDALVEARQLMTATLRNVREGEVLLNFARQLAGSGPALVDWSMELFEQGAALVRRDIERAVHPTVAMDMLFKLTRRQVCDFGRAAEAIAYWDGLSADRKAWLWSTQARYWEYMGLLLEALLREKAHARAEALVRAWMEDPATPAEGRLIVGIPYARWLLRNADCVAALALFEQMVSEAPGHPLCALAWYWKALVAHKAGKTTLRDQHLHALRQAQGVDSALQCEWHLDAKAHLLLADLQVSRVAAEAVNYTPDLLVALRHELIQELDRLP